MLNITLNLPVTEMFYERGDLQHTLNIALKLPVIKAFYEEICDTC